MGSDFASEVDNDDTFSMATDQTMSSNKLQNTAKRLNSMIRGPEDLEDMDLQRPTSGLDKSEPSEDLEQSGAPEITVEVLEEPEKYDLAEAKRRHRQQNFVEAYKSKELGYAIADAEKLLRT